MNTPVRRALWLAVPVLVGLPAFAQEREFTVSRDWHLPPRGEQALELRSFFDTSHGDSRAQLEYEYGVTDHFAFEPGFEVAETGAGDYEVEGADVELRFSFGTYRQGAWLPGFNVEYQHPFGSDEADALEFKGVLSRYGERDDVTLNLTYARELEGARTDATDLSAGWAHALGERATDESNEESDPTWKVGLELVQDFEAHHLSAGPLVSWRASSQLHLLASYLPALDERGEGNFDQLALLLEWEP